MEVLTKQEMVEVFGGHTATQLPISAQELEVLGIDVYTYGGV